MLFAFGGKLKRIVAWKYWTLERLSPRYALIFTSHSTQPSLVAMAADHEAVPSINSQLLFNIYEA